MNRVGEDVQKWDPLYAVGGGVNWCKPLWKTVWIFFRKLKLKLTYDPAISFLVI